MIRVRSVVVAMLVSLAFSLATRAAEDWKVVVAPANSFEHWIMQGDRPVMSTNLVGWGPKWSPFAGADSKALAQGGVLKCESRMKLGEGASGTIQVSMEASKSGEREITYRYVLKSPRELPVTMVTVPVAIQFEQGELIMTFADGKEQTIPLPPKRGEVTAPVAKLTYKYKGLGDVAVSIDPPCRLGPEGGNSRIMLAYETLKPGDTAVAIKFVFPAAVEFVASADDRAKYTKVVAGPDWFAFKGTSETAPSVIGFEPWLEKPAGKHGGVRTKDSQFVFEDGTPVKFWGTNFSYGSECAPEKKIADITARRLAKWGVNGVRLHKPCGPGEGIGDRNDGTQFVPALLDRMDYFAAQLKENGIYYGMSHTFGYHIRPGNRSRYLAYDEIAKNLNGNTYALINFAEDAQDLMIEMVVNLLKHRNPYTGKTWAEEPALSYVELQNEDDIFFYTTSNVLEKCPTYRKNLEERFSDWLKGKYGSQEALAQAWKSELKGSETLAARNIRIEGNPWFMGDGLPAANGPRRTRLLDNAAFLHDVQDKFYTRFAKAIRDAGYQGPLCGSPWQAPAMVPHYYNLLSDYRVGWIDRHNYFGGGFTDTMLKHPGSGYLSSGLQQVIDRPFGISEWIHVYPSLYSAEGPVLMAAYGMGLQGWGSSYEFQSGSNHGAWWEIVGNFPWGVWNADCPTQIGQYPILARMVMRGDVKEGPVISRRNVSFAGLKAGRFNFTDKIVQKGDVKTFEGTTPPEALAAGRVVVAFTESDQPSTFADLSGLTKDSAITSATGQLRWDTSGEGYVTIDTDGTKGIVGFAEGKECTLGNVKVKLECPYASVLITAAGKGETLATARTALVSAVARNCNTGFKLLTLKNTVLDNGSKPVMLEPVKATITIAGRPIANVNVLDHDGQRTTLKLDTSNGTFTIDGTRDKALYYEIAFQ